MTRKNEEHQLRLRVTCDEVSLLFTEKLSSVWLIRHFYNQWMCSMMRMVMDGQVILHPVPCWSKQPLCLTQETISEFTLYPCFKTVLVQFTWKRVWFALKRTFGWIVDGYYHTKTVLDTKEKDNSVMAYCFMSTVNTTLFK